METQTLILPHNIALQHWYRHCQYYTTEHCHVGIGNDSMIQNWLATLVQAQTLSHNRALPHMYRHWQCYTTLHCHNSTGTDNITQQSLLALLHALTISHYIALPQALTNIIQETHDRLLHSMWVPHNTALPHCYRHWQYHTTEHCHIGTGLLSITQHFTYILVHNLSISHKIVPPH